MIIFYYTNVNLLNKTQYKIKIPADFSRAHE